MGNEKTYVISIRLLVSFLCFTALSVSCASRTAQDTGKTIAKSPEQQKKQINYQQLKENTVVTFSSGATFLALKGWLISEHTNKVFLQDPEHELLLTFLLINSSNGKEAIEKAWKDIKPNFSRPIKIVSDIPPNEGWEEVVKIVYESNAAEQRVVIAHVRRIGQDCYVSLMDGTNAAFDRRNAQIRIAITSLEVPGLKKESFEGKTAQKLDQEKLEILEDFIKQVREKAKIPGTAVAIVQEGKIVFEKGFGIRQAGKNNAVTPKSLFMIGSITKSLTTLMMSSLVDQGLFDWETPCISLFPEFGLGDTETTEKMTMKYTVCACTGMPRQDLEFLFEYKDATPGTRLEELKTMKPTTGFGETFQYSNPLVSAGGFIAAHTAFPKKNIGTAYDLAMKKYVFNPIGMSSTTFDFEKVKKSDHAVPHDMNYKMDVIPIPLAEESWVTSIKPAGGAWSNVRNMARYILVELGKGRTPEGVTVVTEKNILNRYNAQVKVSDKASYGLGIVVEDYHGIEIVGHNGGTTGFSSELFFLPEHSIGMVILTNMASAHSFLNTIQRRFIEILFNGKEQAQEDLEFLLRQRDEYLEKELAKISTDINKEWVSKYVQIYNNEGLGRVELRWKDNALIFDAGEWKGAVGVKTSNDNIKSLVLIEPPMIGLELLPEEPNGKVKLVLSIGQHSYVFNPVSK